MSDNIPSAAGMTNTIRTYGAIIVSIAAVVGCSVATVLVLVYPVPEASQALANVVIGGLLAGYGAVINYWLGSSSGSAAKDEKK